MAKTTKGVQDPKTGIMNGSEKNVTPEQILQAFEDYKIHCKKNPKIVEVPNTKTDSVIKLKKEIPLTKKGFILYLRQFGITKNGLEIVFNRDGRYDEFLDVMEYVDLSTTDDQFSGGMAGVFNNNLTYRMLGLTDKQEVKSDETVKITFGAGRDT